MNYNVITFGNEKLRRKSEPVKQVTEEIKALAKDMLTTMYASNGVGLAAEQIARTEAICVVDVSPAYAGEGDEEAEVCPAPMPLVLINPEIVQTEGQAVDKEGCLSFPDIFISVKRPEKVRVRYITIDGKETELETDGFLARALQHEIDHLNGVLLYDHMSAVQRVALAGKLRRLKKAAVSAA